MGKQHKTNFVKICFHGEDSNLGRTLFAIKSEIGTDFPEEVMDSRGQVRIRYRKSTYFGLKQGQGLENVPSHTPPPKLLLL